MVYVPTAKAKPAKSKPPMPAAVPLPQRLGQTQDYESGYEYQNADEHEASVAVMLVELRREMVQSWNTMLQRDLVLELKERKLNVGGTKQDQIARLRLYDMQEPLPTALQFRFVQDVEKKTGVAAKRVQLCHKSLASDYLRVNKV